jgi:hypothetical protein
MKPAVSKGSQTKTIKRSLDKAEGKASPTSGAAGHARAKHAEASPAEMKKRILDDKKDKKKVVTTFKSSGDQDKSLAAALKTKEGLELLAKARSMESGRLTLKIKISGDFACKVAYPYTRVDGKKDSYTTDGKVREVTAILDVKGGKVHIQTAYPSDFHLT